MGGVGYLLEGLSQWIILCICMLADWYLWLQAPTQSLQASYATKSTTQCLYRWAPTATWYTPPPCPSFSPRIPDPTHPDPAIPPPRHPRLILMPPVPLPHPLPPITTSRTLLPPPSSTHSSPFQVGHSTATHSLCFIWSLLTACVSACRNHIWLQHNGVVRSADESEFNRDSFKYDADGLLNGQWQGVSIYHNPHELFMMSHDCFFALIFYLLVSQMFLETLSTPTHQMTATKVTRRLWM